MSDKWYSAKNITTLALVVISAVFLIPGLIGYSFLIPAPLWTKVMITIGLLILIACVLFEISKV